MGGGRFLLGLVVLMCCPLKPTMSHFFDLPCSKAVIQSGNRTPSALRKNPIGHIQHMQGLAYVGSVQARGRGFVGATGRSRSCEEISIDVPVKYVSKERSVSSGVHTFSIDRRGKHLIDDGAQLARWLAESLVLSQRSRVEGVASNAANNRSRHEKYLNNNGASKAATFPYKLRGSDTSTTNSSIAGMPPTPADTFVIRRNLDELNRMKAMHADICGFARTRQLGKAQLSRRFQAVSVSVPTAHCGIHDRASTSPCHFPFRHVHLHDGRIFSRHGFFPPVFKIFDM
jgi:hypothetical protein